jgi:hypothetical protein
MWGHSHPDPYPAPIRPRLLRREPVSPAAHAEPSWSSTATTPEPVRAVRSAAEAVHIYDYRPATVRTRGRDTPPPLSGRRSVGGDELSGRRSVGGDELSGRRSVGGDERRPASPASASSFRPPLGREASMPADFFYREQPGRPGSRAGTGRGRGGGEGRTRGTGYASQPPSPCGKCYTTVLRCVPSRQPSCAVPHPADARHRGLGAAQHSMVPTILSEISARFGISEL